MCSVFESAVGTVELKKWGVYFTIKEKGHSSYKGEKTRKRRYMFVRP